MIASQRWLDYFKKIQQLLIIYVCRMHRIVIIMTLCTCLNRKLNINIVGHILSSSTVPCSSDCKKINMCTHYYASNMYICKCNLLLRPYIVLSVRNNIFWRPQRFLRDSPGRGATILVPRKNIRIDRFRWNCDVLFRDKTSVSESL